MAKLAKLKEKGTGKQSDKSVRRLEEKDNDNGSDDEFENIPLSKLNEMRSAEV